MCPPASPPAPDIEGTRMPKLHRTKDQNWNLLSACLFAPSSFFRLFVSFLFSPLFEDWEGRKNENSVTADKTYKQTHFQTHTHTPDTTNLCGQRRQWRLWASGQLVGWVIDEQNLTNFNDRLQIKEQSLCSLVCSVDGKIATSATTSNITTKHHYLVWVYLWCVCSPKIHWLRRTHSPSVLSFFFSSVWQRHFRVVLLFARNDAMNVSSQTSSIACWSALRFNCFITS